MSTISVLRRHVQWPTALVGSLEKGNSSEGKGEVSKDAERERERERERQSYRQRQREREKQRERETERQSYRQRQKERQAGRQSRSFRLRISQPDKYTCSQAHKGKLDKYAERLKVRRRFKKDRERKVKFGETERQGKNTERYKSRERTKRLIC